MFTIKTEFGEFTGDTMKEAQKAMRKAQRAQVKIDKAAAESRKIAMLRAQSIGYRVLDRFMDKDSPMPAWRFYPTGHKYGPHVVAHFDSLHRMYHDVIYETEDGRGELSHYGYQVVGHVWNGGGYGIVIFLQDNAHPEFPPAAMAVGIADGHVQLASLPAEITPDWFFKEQEEFQANAAAATAAA
jgi:hypothetical protein